MHKDGGRGPVFYCFSPPVMVATFIIEMVCAVYTLWRYKLNTLTRLVTAALCFLALFQLSEYFVCGGTGASTWSRVGFASISMLPPLGLHLLTVLAKRPAKVLVAGAYVTAAACIGYFLLYSQAFAGHACNGNYVIFQLGTSATGLFATYYYGWLLTALALGFSWRRELTGHRKQTVTALMFGYAVFLVPTTIVTTIFPNTTQGIPSIMCGFAVLFAIVLTVYILPNAGTIAARYRS